MFKMSTCNAVATPLETRAKLKETDDEFVSATLYKQIIGSLRYLCNIKPYICQSVGLLSRFMEKPQECHLSAVKRVLRYIKGTIDHGVLMPRQQKTSTDAEVHGYSDSDFNGDQDEKKSIAGYIVMIGGTPISWSSRKQGIVTLSTCEAEYVAASYATCQSAWIELLLKELKIMEPKKMLFFDNKSTIDLANHPMCHGRSKHLERRYHFLRYQINKEKFELEHCKTEWKLSDMLTKPPKKVSFDELKRSIGMRSLENMN